MVIFTYVATEFNDHQRDVFCVFSGIGVQRFRNFLKANARMHAPPYDGVLGPMDDPEMIMDVTAQANTMSMEEMDEELGDASEMMAQD